MAMVSRLGESSLDGQRLSKSNGSKLVCSVQRFERWPDPCWELSLLKLTGEVTESASSSWDEYPWSLGGRVVKPPLDGLNLLATLSLSSRKRTSLMSR